MLQMTSHENFDWFAPIAEGEDEKKATDCRNLHRRLLELASPDTGFLDGLLLNSPKVSRRGEAALFTATPPP